MRLNLATDLKTRTSAPEAKDARLKNCYVEVRGEQSAVRKRPIAQGGVTTLSGQAQGGIGITVGGIDYIYTVNGDISALNVIGIGTTWLVGTTYSIGAQISHGFVNYWSLTDSNVGNTPVAGSSSWSTSYVPAAGKTYATWNPLDKAGAVTLSNGNLTGSILAQGGVRATIGKPSGKWYFEYNITVNSFMTSPENLATVGVATLASFLGNEVGNGVGGWGMGTYNGTSYKANGGSFTLYGAALVIPTVVGIALDMDAGTITFYIDGASQGIAFSNLSGEATYPSIGGQGQGGATLTVVANFGASAFAHSVPSGFNAGLYTQ